jgi:type IV secretion system T-DNA border endonuclease VirD2
MALAPQPPQAIVRRIPKGGTRSLRRIRAQIKYISRDGEVDVYGSPRYGVGPLSQRDIEATLASWVRGTGHFVPGQGETNADSDLTTHLVLSFPEDTDVEAARRAGLAWMNRLFNSGSESTRFDYLATLHTDTAHPHFHVAVNRRSHGDNGTWLSIANQPRPRTSQRSIGLSYTELRRTMQQEALREGIVLSDVAFPTERPLIDAPPEGLSMYSVNTLPQRSVNYDAFLGAPDVDGDDSDDESDGGDEDEDDAGGGGRHSGPPSRSRRDDSPPLPRRRRDGDDADGAPGPSGLTAAGRAEDFRVARIQSQRQGRLHPGDDAAGQTDGASGSSSFPATQAAADSGNRVRRRSIDDDGDQAAKRQRTAASVEEAGASATQPGLADAALDPAATPAGNAAPSGGDRVASAPAGGAASITPARGARRPDLENSPGPMGGDDGLDDFGNVSPGRSATPHAADRDGPAATGDIGNARDSVGLEQEARSTGSPANCDANAGAPSHDRRIEAGSGQMNLFDAGAGSSVNASQPAAQDGTQDQQPGASSDGERAGQSGQAAPKRKRRTEYELLTGNKPPQPGDEPPAKRTRHQAQKAALELRSKKLLMRPFDRDRRDKGRGR